MAARAQLQIQRAGTHFAFDVEGEWTPSVEPVYKQASSPLEVLELRHTWEFRGCRIVSSDATISTLWTDFKAFLALFESRSTHPTYARMVRDPSVAAEVLWTLGPPDYEQFQLELIQGVPDPHVADATWRVTAPFDLRLSAAKRFADANGIVGFEQSVRIAYPGGLRTVEWDTRITTLEGTDAAAKAAAFAAIDITAYPMATYSESSNGPAGLEWITEDADEVNGRTPTVAHARSTIQEWGVAIGATGGGTSPTEVSVETTVRTTADEVETTRVASAQGPNGDAFVAAQALAGYAEREVSSDPYTLTYSTRWTKRKPRDAAAAEASRTLEITLTGGFPAQNWSPISGGHDPVFDEGGRLPFEATVSVTVRRTGGEGKLADVPFPGVLALPWVLDRNASRETEPTLDVPGKDATQHRWVRAAELVYRRPTRPASSVLEEINAADPVETYFLEA